MRRKMGVKNMNIISLEEAEKLFKKLAKNKKKTVLCAGFYEILHSGHTEHFRKAAEFGDVLCVSAFTGGSVNRTVPAVSERQSQLELLASLKLVDYVIDCGGVSSIEMLEKLRPHCFVRGNEFNNMKIDSVREEKDLIKSYGGAFHFVGRTEVENIADKDNINELVIKDSDKRWLEMFRKNNPPEKILKQIRKMENIRALVIGEVIIDEYHFCRGLGKSNKDPILAFNYERDEMYAGGSLAVANHLASFCKNVGLLSYIGEHTPHDDFIKKSLADNIKTYFVTRSGAPTIRKRRFIDSHTGAKVFEVYFMDDTPRPAEEEARLIKLFEKTVENYDMIIVIDYGHGMLSPELIRKICASKPFLAVNTQANAGNRGFNTISKYSRADYVCLAGHEVELETKLKYAPVEEQIKGLEKKIDCSNYTITWGKEGTYHYTSGKGFTRVPAFAVKICDRVGAGDAVLSISSLMSYLKAPSELTGFLSNIAGAIMVGHMGNKVSLNKEMIEQAVFNLLGKK